MSHVRPTKKMHSLPYDSHCLSEENHDDLTAIFLEFPIPIIQRTDLTCFQPTRDAVEVKCVLEGSLSTSFSPAA